MSKECPHCKVIKPYMEFGKNKSTGDKLSAYCRPCMRLKNAEWRRNNPEAINAIKTRERRKNRSRIAATNMAAYVALTCQEKRERSSASLAHYKAMRGRVVAHLGGRCSVCGFADERALQIDHVNSDGAKERSTLSNWRILRNALESVPGVRYQLVCANCNWILRDERGEHKRRVA